MANWIVVLIIFMAVVEVTTKNGKKSVEDVQIRILPVETKQNDLANFNLVDGFKQEQIKKGNPEKKLEIDYSDFLSMGILTDGNDKTEILEQLMDRVRIYYREFFAGSKWHVVTRKPKGIRIKGFKYIIHKRISIEYIEDREIVGSPWDELQSQRNDVSQCSSSASAQMNMKIIPNDEPVITLIIELEETYGKLYNPKETRSIEGTYGKQAARDNMALFLTHLCRKKHIICNADPIPGSGSLYFQSVLGSDYTAVTEHRTSNTARFIYINENKKSSDLDETIPWVHVDSSDISTYLDYWAFFSELRVHVEMLCTLMAKGEDISKIAAEFNSQKKIYFQHLKPPGIYKTMEYIQNLTIQDFEIGSRVLGKGGYGEIRLGRCLQTRQEVALKIEAQDSHDTKDKIQRSKKTFEKEIKILNLINNKAPGILHTFANGTGKFASNRFDYLNELFHKGRGDLDNATKMHLSKNGKVNPSTKFIGIAVERLHISIHALINGNFHIIPDTIRKIIVQMFDCVCNLHNKGILHRDIKPDNFMIDLNTNQTKLIDFGLAKQYKPSGVKDPKNFRGTEEYASYNHLMFKRYQKGDDLEALGLCFYTVVMKKIPTSPTEEIYYKIRANAMQDSRFEAFNALCTSELEGTIRKFFIAIWNYNHPDQQTQLNKAPARKSETVKPTEVSYRKLCKTLRLILTNEDKDFNTEIHSRDIPAAVNKRTYFQILQPERDIITTPITSALESPLQNAVSEVRKKFSQVEKETVGIFITLGVLINSKLPRRAYAKLSADVIIPLKLPVETDELLASICTLFRCILIANNDMGEAHVFYRFNLFAHYFVDILHKKHLTKDDLSKLPFDISQRSYGITRAVLIHGQDIAVDTSSAEGVSVKAISYSGTETTDELVTAIYNAIQQ